MSNENLQRTNASNAFTLFIKKQYKFIIGILVLVVISFCIYVFFEERSNNRNIQVSNKYIQASILIQKDNKKKAYEFFNQIIDEKNSFYSPLSLYQILENDLEKDPKKIIFLFDKILKINKIDKENKNLINIKKALFVSKNINDEKELLDILNPVINSDSIWRNEAITLLASYFSSKGENKKSDEYNKLLSNIN